MTSDRSARANRENAQRSTGPKTPEGRARSSQNARRHGVLAENVTVASEDYESYRNLLEALWNELAPHGERESLLTERLANLFWRERRLIESERGLIDRQQAIAADPFGGGPRSLSLGQQLLIGRYQTMLTNQIASTAQQLRELQLSREEAQTIPVISEPTSGGNNGLPPARPRSRTPPAPSERTRRT